MRSDLQAISFVCAGLLAILLVLPRIRRNVANLAIVLWLLACNLIHGINAIIWAGNIDIHVPAWCDIGERWTLILVILITHF
jgi:pheromone a factor receptor